MKSINLDDEYLVFQAIFVVKLSVCVFKEVNHTIYTKTYSMSRVLKSRPLVLTYKE